MLELIASIYLVLALIVGMISRNRGKTFLFGFFYSLILSPIIGLVIVLVSKKNKYKMINRKIKKGKVTRCPVCGTVRSSRTNICQNCHNISK
ncbi:MAG: hypothetical protein K8S23_13455 [Candidatus Cloacimonetes bacterium]|nr:hypothetical protein [Candidatus Cloacimonadota bacterium]